MLVLSVNAYGLPASLGLPTCFDASGTSGGSSQVSFHSAQVSSDEWKNGSESNTINEKRV